MTNPKRSIQVSRSKNPWEGQDNNNQDDDDDDDESLQNLLKQLRPFQREAYEFATEGKIYQRQWRSDDKETKQQSQNGNTLSSTLSIPSYDPELLGKGRILLAGSFSPCACVLFVCF